MAASSSEVKVVEEEKPKRRRHGLEWPLHPLQILSWVVFGIDLIAFLVFGLPLVDGFGPRLAIAVCLATSIAVVVIFTYRATVSDAVDPNLFTPAEEIKETGDMPFCSRCDSFVHKTSKHCGSCNKCVDVFDHHCMWLNNCVGKRNYADFFVTVSSVAVMLGIIVGTCLDLLIELCTRGDPFQARIEETGHMQDFPREFVMALLISLVFVNLPLFMLDVQLVTLHIFLWSQGITTYEYIINKYNQDTSSDGWSDRIRSLPRFMDWIVTARCGRRKTKFTKARDWELGLDRPEAATEKASTSQQEADVDPSKEVTSKEEPSKEEPSKEEPIREEAEIEA